MRKENNSSRYAVLIAAVIPLVILLIAGAHPLVKVQAHPHGEATPVPIPGFVTIPPFPIEVHAFFPGFMGEDVNHEPTTLTNYRGFTALAYHAGTAMGNDGKQYDFFTDMRVFQGEYVSSDGTHHRGTFALI